MRKCLLVVLLCVFVCGAGVAQPKASFTYTIGTATLNTSALASGHYTVALRNEQSVVHLPVVIVK